MASDPQQPRELARVSSKIERAVVEFVQRQPIGVEWSIHDLGRHVSDRCACAPDSAVRILRNLRQRGVVHYRNTSRSQSLYARVQPPENTQGELFG